MPQCPACGAVVDENMAFCPKCGAALTKTTADQVSIPRGSWSKPKIAFVSGILAGAGIVALIGGLICVFVLNGSYERVGNFLSVGMPPSAVRFALRDIVSFISLGVFGGVIGAYMLIIGLLIQFSRSARLAWERNSASSRIANGLMNAGFIVSGLSAGNLVRQHYGEYLGWFGTASIIALIVGISMFITGLILLLKVNYSPLTGRASTFTLY